MENTERPFPGRNGDRPQAPIAMTVQRCLEGANRLPPALLSQGGRMGLDAGASAVSIYIAFQLRFDGSVPDGFGPTLWAWVLLLPLLRVASLQALGGYAPIWRYFTLRDCVTLAETSLPPTAILLFVRYALADFTSLGYVPGGVVLMELILFLTLAVGMRALRRVSFEAAHKDCERERALVVGTDKTLAMSARHISACPSVDVVGLLTPEAELLGLKIGGHTVIGEPAALPRLLAAGGIDLVLIADTLPDRIGAAIATASEFGVAVRLLPSAESVIRGDMRVWTVPKPEDLLATRGASAAVAAPAVLEAFRDRIVLISGAAGSIGSELCRQVAQLPISSLLLLDQDENGIFEIHHELRKNRPDCNLVPLVGDIRDRRRMEQVFQTWRPQIVLHAAAYKHVPLMESNCCEAVLNNVLGTRMVAELAVAHGTELFLMISTDKAVRPVSAMGTTKRLAEMLVQSLASAVRSGSGLRFRCVRFGNVAGSRGSVVPIFLRQIAAGGPITITHEEMTRYFMTISEAAQLVLQAATLGTDGTVCMLDMGGPVKITQLANNLIEMSGLRPGIDIEIQFIGARPGEKLHEQVWTDETPVASTEFPRVLAVPSEFCPPGFEEALRSLENSALAHDEQNVRQELERFQKGFAKQESVAGAA